MSERRIPYDVDVEQALLGAIMVDESVYWRIADRVSAHDFYDPLHQRMFATAANLHNAGSWASPISLGVALEKDEGLAQVGGRQYLESLARSAPATPNVRDYADIIRRFWQRRQLIAIGEELVERGFGSESSQDSPGKIADQASEALFDATHAFDPGEGAISILDLAHRAAESAELAHNQPKSVWLTSGLKTVDERLGGLFKKDLTVLGAATSMGKTALIQRIMEANSREGHGVLCFSLEMTGEQLATRYLAEKARVPSDRIRQGRTSEKELFAINERIDAFADIRNLLKIDSSRALTVAQMRARTQAFKRRCPSMALVVVDHLQYVTAADPRADEKEHARQVTRDLANMAKELDVAILLISHITKENERRQSKRPLMSDLYGSAGIAQNADGVWFLYRAIYYLEREGAPEKDGKEFDNWLRQCEAERGWAEIFSTKVRMGKTSSTRVRFDEKFTRFYDPGDEDQGAPEQDLLALAH